MSEIRLRASIRIGELVRKLETAERGGAGGGAKIPSAGKSKGDAIADAGLSTSSAHRYEELAGGRNDRGMAAAEAHFAQAQAEQKPATMEGLRSAIKDAVEAALGLPPVCKRPAAAPPVNHDWPTSIRLSAIRGGSSRTRVRL